MSSIITNRKFLIKNPNEIIQGKIDIPIPPPIITPQINVPKTIKNTPQKKNKYFLPEFYI